MNQKKKELITQLQLLKCMLVDYLNGDLVFVEDGNDVHQY